MDSPWSDLQDYSECIQLSLAERSTFKRFWIFITLWSNVCGQIHHIDSTEAQHRDTAKSMSIVFDIPDIAVYQYGSDYYCVVLEEHRAKVQSNSSVWNEMTVPTVNGMFGFRAESIPKLKEMYDRMLQIILDGYEPSTNAFAGNSRGRSLVHEFLERRS